MEILLQAKKHEFRPKPNNNHVCTHEECKPENETALKRRGLLPSNGPMLTNDCIFVCNYGDVHICSNETCMNQNICHISGLSDGHVAQYSSYNRKDPRTYIKDIPSGKYKRKRITPEQVHDQAEYLVETILYSDARKKINEKFKRQQVKLCNKEKNAYTKEEQYPIDLIQLAMVQTKYDSKTLPLEILERDQQRIDYYVSMITQMYSKIEQYVQDKLCVEAITLGLLYKMKQGLKMDGIVVIPVDVFLVDHLPIMNELPVFGLTKRKFTTGEKWINYAIEQARKNGTSLQDIALEEREIRPMKVFKPTSRKIK